MSTFDFDFNVMKNITKLFFVHDVIMCINKVKGTIGDVNTKVPRYLLFCEGGIYCAHTRVGSKPTLYIGIML